ncbi:hypothetical protein RB614_22105 [Phytohabitans sp. ZYX-F-186]|uniref:Uncharacterized protein n=1 Tax=Phytohabitans maris TaxID=3071409 RepID=A0ABU0ZJI0_9ACTN|nr:hypothetical protein [Phytohabitans sp. ZYX-F-186]MDQ7907211.1 hypothetical protein [Phytohabitans sp. ZYX-F-186]
MGVGEWAAFTAAFISGANIVVTALLTRSRDRTSWSRESLSDTLVALLEASWRSSDAVRERHELGPRPADAALATRLDDAIEAAFAELRTSLTRLRLFATERVGAAGVDLLISHRELRDAALADQPAGLDAVSAARRRLIQAARRDLKTD